MQALINDVSGRIHRCGRQIEVALWEYFFEGGSKLNVVNALAPYQNEDGGFGHALEADNWNPNSTPITTQHALIMLLNIEFMDMEHPVMQGIWRYLRSEKDLLEYGWRFTVPTNNEYPHAPWWNYSEEQNKQEYYGVTAGFCDFILRFGEKGSALYQKAQALAESLLDAFMTDEKFGDMGLEAFIHFIETAIDLGLGGYDGETLQNRLHSKVNNSIEHDTEKWAMYGVRPSNYITSPNSPFYAENKEIVLKERAYLLQTKPENDLWPITWTWFDNMEKYGKYFTISENWWKCFKAIEKMRFIKNFAECR